MATVRVQHLSQQFTPTHRASSSASSTTRLVPPPPSDLPPPYYYVASLREVDHDWEALPHPSTQLYPPSLASTASGRLNLPVCVPQISNGIGSPFARAYPEELANVDIGMTDWLAFVDGLVSLVKTLYDDRLFPLTFFRCASS